LNNALGNSQKEAKRIEKLIKNATGGGGAQGSDDLLDDQDDEEKMNEEQKIARLEMKELEKIIEDKHANYAKISRHYKLFEYVAKKEPSQVLRYAKPRSPQMDPLWVSEKGIMPLENVPKCPRCGSQRLFEVQVMPQIFEQLKELMLVDWATIAVYTCSSAACYPNLAKGENYIEELGFI
jgi:pre-rRNA-processing protein TSR4